MSREFRISPELFDAMREKGDPVADELVARIVSADGEDGLKRLAELVEQGRSDLDRAPAEVRQFLAAPVAYPAWIEARQLHRAQELFRLWGMETMLVLFTCSMPQFFAAAHASPTFQRANIFQGAAVRHFMVEIAQLLFDVMWPGGLDPEPEKSAGVIAVQKLRLYHAVVRHRLRSRGDWDPAWGAPINQENLALSVAAFSVWTLDGFDKLRIPFTPEDRQAVLTLWQTLGFLLGLDEELQPADLDEARRLLAAVGRRQWQPSAAGRQLVRQLIDVIQGFLPGLFDDLPVHLMRFLMEPRFVELLDVPRPRAWSRPIAAVAGWLLRRGLMAKRFVGLLCRRLAAGLAGDDGRRGQRGRLRLPTEIAQRHLEA